MWHGADASSRIIAVIKLVRVNELPLVSILVVSFDKLVRELAHQHLIIGWVTALVDVLTIVSSAHGWSIVPNGIIRHFVGVRYSHIALITTARKHFPLLYTLLRNKWLLGVRHGSCGIIFIANWVCRALVELVMIFQLLGLFLAAGLAALAEVWVWDRGEPIILWFHRLERTITFLWLPSRVRIYSLHLREVIFRGFVLLLCPTHILLFRLYVVNKVPVATASSVIIVSQLVILLIEGELHWWVH